MRAADRVDGAPGCRIGQPTVYCKVGGHGVLELRRPTERRTIPMKMTRWILIVALVTAVAPVLAGPECSKHKEQAETVAAHECTGDCANCPMAEALSLAEKAGAGCQASTSALYAMARESGDEKAIALAGKAAGGCEHSKGELIAMVKQWGGKETAEPSMAELAKKAGGGCSASSAKLIEMAKKSDNQKAVNLAEAAAGGCEHSKDALIALLQEEPKQTATK